MAIRVAHIGTGNVGRIALNHLISDPRFELTGVWVSSDAKVGKDAGELAGLEARPASSRRTIWTRCWPPAPSAPSTARWATTGYPRR